MKRRKTLIRKDTLLKYHGMLMTDIAKLIDATPRGKGCGYKRVYTSIHRHGIRHLFPANGGEASFLSRVGYCD